ncbi:MFS general substrate transporter [Aspergillus sclerotiicarbonarius CBS 121057]|uniref:MFS general substrate transporter n=1 Tax=Aspergillus sclerotiicarbonarius (strain CBS 121057 / IBT 28362) TaxID=1448318 RepID=A0A319ECM2_ASPSB|nr:MFS general substrate transporter [Aspergillus sclerotiicarbonarius CBS 121057]
MDEKPAPPPVPITFPDGGLRAWLQVVVGFFLMLNTWGLINCFGVFETYYTTTLSPPLAATFSVAWIGSLQLFLLLFVGAFCGQAFDAGWTTPLAVTGSLLCIVGMLCTSFSHLFWQTLLAQGICTGLGMGLLFVPSVTLAATYFQRYRARALGVVTTGASVGGIIYPIALRQLTAEVGFAWAVRAITLVILVTLSISCLLIQPRTDLPRPKKYTLISTIKNARIHFTQPSFTIYLVSMFFMFLGLLVPYNYLEEWITDMEIDMGRFPTAYILSLMNAAGVLGRLIPSVLSDLAISPILVQAFSVLACGILNLCWLRLHSAAGVLVWAIFYGFFSGASVSLPPASMAKQTADLSTLGVRMGLMFTVASFGSLISYPVVAALLKSAAGWDAARVWAGVVLFVGGVGMGWMGWVVYKVKD